MIFLVYVTALKSLTFLHSKLMANSFCLLFLLTKLIAKSDFC